MRQAYAIGDQQSSGRGSREMVRSEESGHEANEGSHATGEQERLHWFEVRARVLLIHVQEVCQTNLKKNRKLSTRKLSCERHTWKADAKDWRKPWSELKSPVTVDCRKNVGIMK